MEDPWPNWHKPEEALETEVATTAQRKGQQYIKSPSVSVVVAEPFHADLMLLEVPQKGP